MPQLLEREEFNQCQTIYAGGDDLFIIGSWHQLPNLAKFIREEFRKFCCMNPDFSISGGITLQREKYPIYKGALLAGDAENLAKELRSSRNPRLDDLEKDALCFLDVPIAWEDLEIAEEIKDLLEDDIKENRGLLSFLSGTVATNKGLVMSLQARKGITGSSAWKEIEYASWRWRTAYHLKRRYPGKEDRETLNRWSKILFSDKSGEKKATLPIYTWLELPVRWTEYAKR